MISEQKSHDFGYDVIYCFSVDCTSTAPGNVKLGDVTLLPVVQGGLTLPAQGHAPTSRHDAVRWKGCEWGEYTNSVLCLPPARGGRGVCVPEAIPGRRELLHHTWEGGAMWPLAHTHLPPRVWQVESAVGVTPPPPPPPHGARQRGSPRQRAPPAARAGRERYMCVPEAIPERGEQRRSCPCLSVPALTPSCGWGRT